MSEPFVKGHVRRDFVEYDHPEGAYTLRAHRVTKSTEGEVSVVGGGAQYVHEGQVLVETERPGTYDIHEGSAFDEMNLDAVSEQQDLGTDEDDEPDEKPWDPNEHNAGEVRRYLLNPSTSVAERNRVVNAERNGLNRTSAVPRNLTLSEGDTE